MQALDLACCFWCFGFLILPWVSLQVIFLSFLQAARPAFCAQVVGPTRHVSRLPPKHLPQPCSPRIWAVSREVSTILCSRMLHVPAFGFLTRGQQTLHLNPVPLCTQCNLKASFLPPSPQMGTAPTLDQVLSPYFLAQSKTIPQTTAFFS